MVFSAQLQLTGPGAAGATDQGWGVTRTGYQVGNSTTLTESVTLIDAGLCTNTATVTSVNGTTTNTPLGASFPVPLPQPTQHRDITNTVTCESTTDADQVRCRAAAPRRPAGR